MTVNQSSHVYRYENGEIISLDGGAMDCIDEYIEEMNMLIDHIRMLDKIIADGVCTGPTA